MSIIVADQKSIGWVIKLKAAEKNLNKEIPVKKKKVVSMYYVMLV